MENVYISLLQDKLPNLHCYKYVPLTEIQQKQIHKWLE